MARSIFWDDQSQEQYECEDCGRGLEEIHGKFEVHHKDGNPYNNDPENLVGLCKACHAIREGRKPGSDSVYRILRQFKRERVAGNETDRKAWLLAKELIHHFPTGHTHRKLGFSREKRKEGFTPKTRREAAIYQQGAIDFASDLYDDVVCRTTTELGSNVSCASCGDTDKALEVHPSESYGDLDDRLPFCYDCSEEILEGNTSLDSIYSEMWAHVESKNSDTQEKLESKEDGCMMCIKDEIDGKIEFLDGSTAYLCRSCGKTWENHKGGKWFELVNE